MHRVHVRMQVPCDHHGHQEARKDAALTVAIHSCRRHCNKQEASADVPLSCLKTVMRPSSDETFFQPPKACEVPFA